MKPSDGLFLLFLGVLALFLMVPFTHRLFFDFTDDHVLLGGFIKFFIFASIGDVVSWRFKHKHYRVPGLMYKAIAWGILGVLIVMAFSIFHEGVRYLQESRILPFGNITFFHALFTSILMNLLFAPTMMLLHRISDQVIDRITQGKHGLIPALTEIDYVAFLRMLSKTIPFFWIPMHTITFLLPGMYRAFFASLLGIALGLLLTGFKKSRA